MKTKSFLLSLLLLTGCANTNYNKISSQEAQSIMENESDIVVVDVRTKEEYDSGHIPEAINIPNESIQDQMPSQLPDLEQKILIYCRSGNRSKQAASKLVDIGYTQIYEFGGINSWQGPLTE